mgnify:CR=1 FL=1
MVTLGALGDVVQQHRDVERLAGLDLVDQLVGERVLVLQEAALDLGDVADRPDEMLVHRVMVVHVELHQRDDAAEGWHEAAEHAAFVHPSELRLRICARRQHLEEQPVRFRIGPELVVDQVQRPGHRLQRVGVDVHGLFVGEPEEPQQVHRIAREDVRPVDVQPPALDEEAGRDDLFPAAEAEQAADPGGFRLMLVLQHGAEDAGEIAHLLGGQEVVLHEPLDRVMAVAAIAHAQRHFALHVEAQPVLGAAGEEVEVAAHGPQEVLGAGEGRQLVGREHALVGELCGILHPVDILGDPEERVEVAQPAFALLHVGFDQIAALARLAMARVALGELGVDEIERPLPHDLLVEARLELVVEPLVAPQVIERPLPAQVDLLRVVALEAIGRIDDAVRAGVVTQPQHRALGLVGLGVVLQGGIEHPAFVEVERSAQHDIAEALLRGLRTGIQCDS